MSNPLYIPEKNKIWQESPILFHSLIADNYDEFVKKVFNYSSLINSMNSYGENLLHYACFYGMIDKYYALVNMGATIEKTKKKNTLLHYATLSGKDDFLILELIKSGLSPLDKNNLGHTSIHYAKNERICHYFNLWCLRNNIEIKLVQDYKKNTVAHSCYALDNVNALEYWLKNYPELMNQKNDDGISYNKLFNFQINEENFCPL